MGLVAQTGSRDSCCESSVIAGVHEQLAPYELHDQKLVTLYSSPEAAWFAFDLV